MTRIERPNWVPERAKCNVTSLFETLTQVIGQDVNQANETFGFEEHPFTSTLDSGGAIEVMRKNNRMPRAVFFRPS